MPKTTDHSIKIAREVIEVKNKQIELFQAVISDKDQEIQRLKDELVNWQKEVNKLIEAKKSIRTQAQQEERMRFHNLILKISSWLRDNADRIQNELKEFEDYVPMWRKEELKKKFNIK